jgi:hypothetical protein
MEAAPLSAIELQQLQESKHTEHELDKATICTRSSSDCNNTPIMQNSKLMNIMISRALFTGPVAGSPTIPFQIST